MSEEKREMSYGGQAVMEGVMMRGSKAMAVAVRQPDGEIVIHTEPLNAAIYTGTISKIPFLRALTSLWDVLVLGIRTLMYSADVALGEEEDRVQRPHCLGNGGPLLCHRHRPVLCRPPAAGRRPGSLHRVLVAEQHHRGSDPDGRLYRLHLGHRQGARHRRVFAYHGAEHKTINAYEAGAELTPEEVAKHSTAHYRCGTAFLLSVMIISILVFSLLGRPPMGIRILSRIVLIPVVAGVAYEYIKFTNRHRESPIIRTIAAPNLALQSLTTREPDISMLEVSIAALKRVLETEKDAAGPEPTSA